MALMDFFRNATPTNAPASAPAQGQPNGAPATTQTPPNEPNGNHQKPEGTNQPANPLDSYTKMFDNASKATPEAPPAFALDGETVGKVSNSLDFTKDLPADLMTKALAGDAQALMQAMNHVARSAYQTTLQHSSMLTDKFVGTRLDFEGKNLGSRVKQELTSSALANTPNYKHPVVKAELNRIASMMQREHPDASPQQIAESAQEYLMQVTAALSPQKEAEAAAKDQDFDWSSYLTSQKS